jgi:hypothetical protein
VQGQARLRSAGQGDAGLIAHCTVSADRWREIYAIVQFST